MESKKTKDMLDNFPRNIKFVENIKDPLHIMVDGGGRMLTDLEREKSRKIDNLLIDKGNPVEPSGVYYIEIGENIHNVDIQPSGDARLVDSSSELLENNITGFDLVDELEPSGLPTGSGILGVSFGFDWDEDSLYYLTASGCQYVYSYTDFSQNPTETSYFVNSQRFDVTGEDEYINFLFEEAGYNALPSGVNPGDIVKVAYLNNDKPISDTLKVIDIGNLKNPDNDNSDGIVVNGGDYAVTGNRIIFSHERHDYEPATIVDYGETKDYIYPSGYQPDKNFDSIFIVEYDYKVEEIPRYLSQSDHLHNVGIKDNPQASS